LEAGMAMFIGVIALAVPLVVAVAVLVIVTKIA
jgi:hypothetical protein